MSSGADVLKCHPLFSSPDSGSGSWEEVEGPADGLVGRKQHRLATRGSDVIVAQGKELRMATLTVSDAEGAKSEAGRAYVVRLARYCRGMR